MAASNNPFGSNSAMNDDFDINDFVQFDQGFHNSPSPTAVKMEPHQSLDPREVMHQSTSQSRPQYNGPSHNYDQFRQQTGLPTGAISHVHAVNQFSNSNHVRPTNFAHAHFAGYNTGFDFGVDGNASTDSQNFYMPGDGSDEFAVDPAAIAPDSVPSNAFRAWPGMHSQQAKQQAQAEAEAKQQQREEAMQSQRPLPSNFEENFGGRSRSQTNTSEQQANEQISRLLNQMRQNSNASLDDDEDSKGNLSGAGLSHSRKAEDDMDEDERLLASEEGKKLSSKERRQLRNKVSARAFRSRRKEYITQLEGEVAMKNNECNDLKFTNRHLLEQNRQLTGLCKAMLSHPSFNNFMEEMSNDPSILSAFAPQTQSSESSSQPAQQKQQQQPSRQQDQSSSQSSQPQHQQNIHVGMTMMPETNLDFSMLNLGGGNHWANYQQPQIYALYEVPAGPSMEELSGAALSGKDNQEVDVTALPDKLTAPRTKELPSLSESRANVEEDVKEEDIEDIKNDPAFALYVDCADPQTAACTPLDLSTALTQLEISLSEKPSSQFQLHVRTPQDDADAINTIDRLFARSVPVLRRMEMLTRHLDL